MLKTNGFTKRIVPPRNTDGVLLFYVVLQRDRPLPIAMPY
jgi:hypothetical protein